MSEDVINYCLEKKAAAEDYPFGPDPLVVKIGGKMFALISKEKGNCDISLKCDPVIAENLREQYRAVRPGYHLNKKHWNTITIDGSLPNSDLFAMIDHSYELVFKSLPKALQASLA